MNILIFVSVMLMVLASISYNELQLFYRQALSHAGWVHYMDTVEGCLFNKKIQSLYQKERKSKTEPKTETDTLGHLVEKGELEEKPAPKKIRGKGSARINFRILLGTIKDASPEVIDQYHSLIKELIVEVYGKTIFYQALIAERPLFVDELLVALKKDFEDKKIKTAKQIEKLELKDKQLNDFFYLMLRKLPIDGDDKNKCASISFVDFLSDSPLTAVRVYLAPKPILLAAFKNSEIVDQIMEKRDELYKRVDKDKYAPEKATEEFQNAFDVYSPYHDILDFTVNKTNPSTYK